MTKILYEKPLCQTLVIRFGGKLLSGSDGITGSRSGYDDYFNLDLDDDEE